MELEFLSIAEQLTIMGGLMVSGFVFGYTVFWATVIPYQLSRALVDAS